MRVIVVRILWSMLICFPSALAMSEDGMEMVAEVLPAFGWQAEAGWGSEHHLSWPDGAARDVVWAPSSHPYLQDRTSMWVGAMPVAMLSLPYGLRVGGYGYGVIGSVLGGRPLSVAIQTGMVLLSVGAYVQALRVRDPVFFGPHQGEVQARLVLSHEADEVAGPHEDQDSQASPSEQTANVSTNGGPSAPPPPGMWPQDTENIEDHEQQISGPDRAEDSWQKVLIEGLWPLDLPYEFYDTAHSKTRVMLDQYYQTSKDMLGEYDKSIHQRLVDSGDGFSLNVPNDRHVMRLKEMHNMLTYLRELVLQYQQGPTAPESITDVDDETSSNRFSHHSPLHHNKALIKGHFIARYFAHVARDWPRRLPEVHWRHLTLGVRSLTLQNYAHNLFFVGEEQRLQLQKDFTLRYVYLMLQEIESADVGFFNAMKAVWADEDEHDFRAAQSSHPLDLDHIKHGDLYDLLRIFLRNLLASNIIKLYQGTALEPYVQAHGPDAVAFLKSGGEWQWYRRGGEVEVLDSMEVMPQWNRYRQEIAWFFDHQRKMMAKLRYQMDVEHYRHLHDFALYESFPYHYNVLVFKVVAEMNTALQGMQDHHDIRARWQWVRNFYFLTARFVEEGMEWPQIIAETRLIFQQ